jgi:hypothetical protein
VLARAIRSGLRDFWNNEKDPPRWSAQSITCELGVARAGAERLVDALRDAYIEIAFRRERDCDQ